MENEFYRIENNVLEGKISYHRKCPAVPEGVTEIESNAFTYCQFQEDFTLPDSLEVIGKEAFENSYLTRISLPQGIRAIGSGAFRGCSDLRTIDIPANVRIGTEAFAECDALRDVRIGSDCSIGNYAFSDCPHLKNIYLEGPPKKLGKAILAFASPNCRIHWPAGMQETEDLRIRVGLPDKNGMIIEGTELLDYLGDADPVEIPEGITTIHANAFKRISYPRRIHLPDSIECIRSDHLNKMKANLPPTYLKRQKPLPAKGTLDLLDGVFRGQATLEDRAALFLFQGPKLQAYALKWLHDPDAFVRSMLTVLQSTEPSENALSRAAIYIVDRYDALSAQTKNMIAESLCGHGSKEQVQAALLEDLIPEPLLDTILWACGVQADSRKFSTVSCPAGVLGGSLVVKNALVPYLAQSRMLCESPADSSPKHFFVPRLMAGAEAAASRLSPADLQNVVSQMFPRGGNVEHPEQSFPFCRYASDAQINRFIDRFYYTFAESSRYHRRDRFLRAALMLSDGEPAVTWAGNRRTGMSANPPIDTYVAIRLSTPHIGHIFPKGLGLDADGNTQLHQGEYIYDVSISDSLMPVLRENGSVIKSIPRTPADIAGRDDWRHMFKRTLAQQRYESIRRFMEQTEEYLRDRCFHGFVFGDRYSLEDWMPLFDNPILRPFFFGLVWSQEGRTFSMSKSGLCDAHGISVTLMPDQPIQVAHPLDMTAQERETWLSFLSHTGAKAPFEQLQEPIYTAAGVAAMQFAKQKIRTQDADLANDAELLDSVLSRRISIKNLEITSSWPWFSFVLGEVRVTGPMDRAANHVLFALDKITLVERALKNDMSVIPALFTLPAKIRKTLLQDILGREQPGNEYAEIVAALLDIDRNENKPAKQGRTFHL